MPYTDAAKNGMLESLRQRLTHLSIHTADPGLTGANEVASGAYARVAADETDFDAPAGGVLTLNNDQAFVAAAAEGATHFGVWDTTTFLGGGPITGDTAFNAEGDFTLAQGTTLDLNAV